MRIRHSDRSEGGKDKLQMTAMIDIVFLLLIFFVMTFKVLAPEGDFNIKMPQKPGREALPPGDFPPLVVQLRAAQSGRLAAIRLGDRSLSSFGELRREIRRLVGDDAGPGSAAGAEVELKCDADLHFEHVIDAVTAVSGYVADDGRSIVKLIDNIKLGSR
jgi:biopolymer transport protein ExbD